MSYAYIDFETRSTVNIKDGLDRYFTRAEATICTLAIDNGPVHCWDILQELSRPQWFLQAVQHPSLIFVAHNAVFDFHVLKDLLAIRIPWDRWICTRAQAYAHGLVGGLDGLCQILDVPMDLRKRSEGKRLIQLFCVPRKDGTFLQPWESPYEWDAFKNYACGDIDALRSVHRRLPAHNFTGANLRYFFLNAKINDRGFAVDVPLVEAAISVLDKAKHDGDFDIAEATQGAVTAVTQRNKLLAYLQARGVNLPNLTKAELENALQRDDISPEERFIIEARLEGARASGAKYKRATKLHVGGRLRHAMQFSGAGRTGRTAHKGFQPGNMPRAVTYNPLSPTLAGQHVPVEAEFIDDILLPAIRSGSIDPLITGRANTVAANSLRQCIVAEPGNELIVADYKNIESRVLAWLAGESWKIKAYNEGEDLYTQLYSRFFGIALEKVNAHERNAGKVVELACGFGGSVGAFVTMAVGYGIDLFTLPALVLPNASAKALAKAEQVWWRAFLSHEDYDLEPDVYIAIHVLVQMYRSANPNIDSLKKQIGRAVESAVRLRGSFYEVGRCKIWANVDVLIVELPSGYRLCYWGPKLELEQYMDPETGEIEERSKLWFKRARGSNMILESSWPGLTLENIVQSTANQVLRHGELEVDKEWPGCLVLDVHDEAVAEAPVGAIPLEPYMALLTKGWWWTQGLPLAADGWVGPRYGKR